MICKQLGHLTLTDYLIVRFILQFLDWPIFDKTFDYILLTKSMKKEDFHPTRIA